MKFLADENVEGDVIGALRRAGHEVVAIAEDVAGIRDKDVLARSVEEGRILITNDKDFAELAFLQRSAATGIVLIRLPNAGSREKAVCVEAAVTELGDRLSDAMTVVEATATRRRSLPRLAVLKGRPGTES
jgi:predicted nuclease of predicted toxin-antitoxin system